MASHISIKMPVLYVAVGLSTSWSLLFVHSPAGEQQALEQGAVDLALELTHGPVGIDRFLLIKAALVRV